MKQGEPTEPFLRLYNTFFEDLTIRWPYSPAMQRVAAWVVRWSIGFRGSKWTPWPVDLARIVADTGLSQRVVWQSIRNLKRLGLLVSTKEGKFRIVHNSLRQRIRERYTAQLELGVTQMVHSGCSKKVTPVTQMSHSTPTKPQGAQGVAAPLNYSRNYKEKGIRLPAPPGNSDQGSKRTPAQIDNDRQVESFLGAWRLMIGGCLPPTPGRLYPLIQKMVNRARRIDTNPVWLISQCSDAIDPRGYFMAITTPGPNLATPDESGLSFHDWLREITPRSANRGNGTPSPVGDVLAGMSIPGGGDDG